MSNVLDFGKFSLIIDKRIVGSKSVIGVLSFREGGVKVIDEPSLNLLSGSFFRGEALLMGVLSIFFILSLDNIKERNYALPRGTETAVSPGEEEDV